MNRGPVPAREPTLSIIIPAYEVERYISTCLDSVIAQANDSVEIVAVNDASPDRSGAILDEYARRDPRVRVLHLPTNTGLGQARNAGLDAATGDYVWFVDGDDWLPAGSVAAVQQRLATTPDVLVVDHAEVFDDRRVVGSRPAGLLSSLAGPVSLAERPQLLQAAQSACTKIIRRDFLDEITLRFEPGWYEDSSFSHPLLLAANKIEVLDRICYCYRQRAQGITRTVDARHFDVFAQYGRLFDRVHGMPRLTGELHNALFHIMINHYMVILGHEARVPPLMRRQFFQRVVAEYYARMPAQSYRRPSGIERVKHALVRRDAYRTYQVFRTAYRLLRPLRRLRRQPEIDTAPVAIPSQLRKAAAAEAAPSDAAAKS